MANDLRTMLLKAGVGQFTVPLAIPFMNMMPGTTDPYAQGVTEIVRGLQRMLNSKGARLDVDGGMGDRTIAAVKTFAGPLWYDKTWAQLYADVARGKRWSGWIRESRYPGNVEESLEGFDFSLANPLVLASAVGAAAYFLFKKG